jgi:hypothetical protein
VGNARSTEPQPPQACEKFRLAHGEAERSEIMPKPVKPARRRNVTSHEYDPETGHLTVTFHSGKRYRYEGVPKALAKEFKDHHSQGGFLHSRVIGKFQSSQLDTE